MTFANQEPADNIPIRRIYPLIRYGEHDDLSTTCRLQSLPTVGGLTHCYNGFGQLAGQLPYCLPVRFHLFGTVDLRQS